LANRARDYHCRRNEEKKRFFNQFHEVISKTKLCTDGYKLGKWHKPSSHIWDS